MRASTRPRALGALAAMLAFAPTPRGSSQLLVEPTASSEEQVQALLNEASNAIAAIYDYRGIIVKKELFEDELVEQKLAFKFSRPFRVYVKYLQPHPGREGLYIEGVHKNRLRAHRGSARNIVASLKPRGWIAMMDNHHPITSFGLENMLNVAKRNIDKAIARGDATLTLTVGGTVYGEPTWRIDLETKAGGYTVTARRGETLWDIARRTGQDMYVILHHNDAIESPNDVSVGQEVFVPHYYASRGQYFISARSYVMIRAISWDHRGNLYESYEYPELELNPGLRDRDFDYRNEDYDFVRPNQR
jgi:LysM repeat protein